MPSAHMSEEQWRKKYEQLGALWIHNGDPNMPHGEMTSGKHSNGFFNSSLVTYRPRLCRQACQDLWRKSINPKISSDITGVFGSAMGAVSLATLFGDILGVAAGYTEKDGDVMVNKRFPIEAGQKFILIEDVMTTGGTNRKTITALEDQGAIVTREIFVLVNRSGMRELDGRTVTSLITADLPLWGPESCPLCKQGSKALRPKTHWDELTGKATV